jgi:DinB family protein
MLTRSGRGYRSPRARRASSSFVSSSGWRTSVYQAVELNNETEENIMGAKGETLAKQFEAKAQEAATVLEKLSDADWKKVTEAEKWSVGVTAHHLAGSYERVPDIATGLAAGQSFGNFTRKILDERNAQHARDFAGCTKEETLALHRKGAAKAASVVRGFSDEQLAKSGVLFTDAPPMTVEQLIMGALIYHTDEHYGSIRKTVGV